MSIKMGRNKGLVCGVLAAFSLLVLPVGQLAFAAEAGVGAETGALSGFVFGQDMKTPVTGAVVKIRNVNDQKEMASQPTDSNGVFAIPAIPEGRYVLGVTSGRSDFNFDYSVHVKAGELGKLTVALEPGAKGQDEPAPAAPKKAGFFNTAGGRALLVTVVGVGVYFLFFHETSPDRR
ncbi:MAG TPA: carboxypeptidase-like regulatory domain-containing protein [Candidatus Aminicenantes bacterium]|nr:carboxypeptidase-like regulatory domain-containing protein [Candidatus Aminicenantes bacterium]